MRAAAAVGLLGLGSTLQADDTIDNSIYLEEVTIVGTRDQVQRITGSAHLIGTEELERFSHTDIQRVARQVPGVSIQVEDGYGLRPNISIRGVATERSGRITLLEDNVLIAPAPYSAPSAYYFPTVGRMAAFEVLKGPAAITQGPYTIGGAFNMISTPIPRSVGGNLMVEAGEDATYRLHATYGGTYANGFGYLVETHQWQSDGFQRIDRGGRDTGLDVKDYTVKLAYAPTDSPHSVELKVQLADQSSDQSYLGLTDSDFSSDPIRRYGLSALDHIDTEHEQVIVRYQYAAADSAKITATAYNNTHARSWFKTEGIDLDGSPSAEDFSRTSWFNVVNAVNLGQSIGDLTAGDLAGILDGTIDTPAGSIQLRANDREYFSRGVQLGLSLDLASANVDHSIEFGVRLHEDEEDRLQRNSAFSQRGGSLVLDDIGLMGNAGNRIQEAQALSLHVFDRIELGAWTLTPGLRYEDIDQGRIRYETRSGLTDDPASRGVGNVRDTRSNTTRVWLPGIGALYDINDEITLLGGVHKGFTAPSNAPGVDEEEALNYELGVRYHGVDGTYAEAVWFLSDYDNLLGECTSSSGADCEVGDAFNGDAVTVKGVELNVGTDLGTGETGIPVQLVYTYIDGSFDTDIADTDFFGSVSAGDPIPYIPSNQLNATVGLVTYRWSMHLSANYVDEVCVRASCAPFEATQDTLAFDLAGRFEVNDRIALFARIENLTDSDDIVSRHPYGARPNKARTAALGFNISL